MDKWDVFEILYRSIIFVAIVGTTGYFSYGITTSLVGSGKSYAFVVATIIIFGWLILAISVLAWLTLVAKGSFRPVEELPEDMDIDELEQKIQDGEIISEMKTDEVVR